MNNYREIKLNPHLYDCEIEKYEYSTIMNNLVIHITLWNSEEVLIIFFGPIHFYDWGLNPPVKFYLNEELNPLSNAAIVRKYGTASNKIEYKSFLLVNNDDLVCFEIVARDYKVSGNIKESKSYHE